MTFEKHLHRLSCALVSVGFFAVLLAEAYQVICAIGLCIVGLYYLKPQLFYYFEALPVFIWNTFILSLLGYLFYDSFYGSLDLVGNAIVFVMALQIIKLLSRKTNRDWWQIYSLSFLQIISSTVLSDSLSFALPFFIYLFVITWTLALFNIKVQYEDVNKTDHEKLLNSKNIVGRSFFFSTAALCTLILSITLLIFFMLPRVSFKQFLRRAGQQEDISGFSSEVELGTIGTIKSNSEIAFRVELSESFLKEERDNLDQLYWRATSADYFDGKKWIQKVKDQQRVFMKYSDPTIETEKFALPGQKTFKYKVFLQHLSSPVLFLADRALRVHWNKPFVERYMRKSFIINKSHEYGSLQLYGQDRYVSDLTYTGESSIGGLPIRNLLAIKNFEVSETIAKRYLQLPDLHPNVKRLFDQIEFPNDIPEAGKVLWLMQYLKKNYKYTLDVQDRGVPDPLRFFFLQKKKGHCEYFSTALIVMLRYFGIPARQTVGFRGGELNSYGSYLAVRQSDAHSWVEVHFPKYGWVRFDPTPPDHLFRIPSEFLRPVTQFFDYLRLRWNNYIVEYDLKTQVAALTKVSNFFKSFRSSKESEKLAFEKDESLSTSQRTKKIAGPILWFIFGLLSIGLVLFFVFKKYLRPVKKHIYQPILKMLRKKGFIKKGSETVLEFQKRIHKEKPFLSKALRPLNQTYYAFRYGQGVSLKDWNKAFFKLKENLKK